MKRYGEKCLMASQVGGLEVVREMSSFVITLLINSFRLACGKGPMFTRERLLRYSVEIGARRLECLVEG